ncbi:hypothetical protein MesoLj131a_18720 [Mesorhizobium sp. 131-2-1]|nr:hypothetical protein MesoLj131a_18720 [Mesorhizobium sp. 131-2-1]
MAALADAGDDDAALDARNQLDGVREGLGQPVLKRGGKHGHAGLLGRHGSQRRIDRILPVRPILFWGPRMHG